MKKVNWSKIGIIAIITLAVGLVVSTVTSMIILEGIINASTIFGIFCFYVVTVGLIVYFVTKSVFKKQADKTIESAAKKGIFGSTFRSNNAFIRIDEENEKVACVSVYNPTELFLLDPKQIHDIKADYIKGPLGGTSYVYFQFYYGKQKLRFPTFLSNQAYMIRSAEVQTGISKAETYRDILKRVSAK